MNESTYQRQLIGRIEALFPGCFIFRNNPADNQGVPDLLILYGDQWAMLEVKRSSRASRQPNQEHYVGMFDDMSFAAFINPQNEDQVLHDLQSAFGAGRKARIS